MNTVLRVVVWAYVVILAGCVLETPPQYMGKKILTISQQEESNPQYIEVDPNKLGISVFYNDFKGKYVIFDGFWGGFIDEQYGGK